MAAFVEADVNGPTDPERLATARVGTRLTRENNDNVLIRILLSGTGEEKVSVSIEAEGL